MTDTPDWADEIVGKVFEGAFGMIGEMSDCAQALRDLAAEKDKEIERLKARCVVLAAVIHSVEAWHMVPDEDQKP